MRARISAYQARLLLNGKPLKHMHTEFKLPKGECEVRKILETYISDKRIQERYELLLEIETNEIIVRKRAEQNANV